MDPWGKFRGALYKRLVPLWGEDVGLLQPWAEVFLFAVSGWKLEISCSGAAAFLPAQQETDTSTGFAARDRLIRLVCDRQKSQITENGTWKIKNEAMWNEFSIYFCNIDFSSVLKMFVLNIFLSKGEKKEIAQYVINIPPLKKFILMQLCITFVQ